ncbi:MAG: radical SAM/SPASM domain-containing protein [Acidobacteriota bacterium]
MLEKSLSFNLEPTFRCNLQCDMCPRFSSEDPHLDMSMETYSRIHEAMVYAHTVDFTGWGEPLLHKRIFEMIGRARDRGCVTTMTSNGTALTEKNGLSLIEAGLDRLTVSVDGTSADTYDRIRTGASFEKVSRNLEDLSHLIDRSGSGLELGIAFTVQESNAHQLGEILPWMQRVGVRVLHLKHLNVISNADDWDRSFLKYRLSPVRKNGHTLQALEGGTARLREQARSAGVRLLEHSEFPLTSEKNPRHCLATPLESVYFSYEGRMAPCCHFGHHVSRYFEGQLYAPSALFFGDIRKHDFVQVWEHPAYSSFRQGFISRDYPDACKTCYLLYGK